MVPILQANQLVFQNFLHYPPVMIPGEKTVFISGKSGSGKSTLLRLFNGTLSPSAGTVYYHGKDVAALDAIALRKEVLLVNQSSYLFDTDIRGNFKQFYNYRDLPTPTDDAIREYCNLCRADFPLDTRCISMSGGEQQRVFLALHLSFQPRVLMLDEPTSALDAENARLVFENLKSFCRSRDMTLLAVSHDAALVEQFADEVISLERSDA